MFLVSLYEKIIKPISKSEDDKRKEFILNVLLVGSIILSIIASLVLVFDLLSSKLTGSDYKGSSFSFVIIIGLILALSLLYYLSRKSYFTLSSYVLILILLLPVMYCNFYWGFELPAGLLGFALIIVMSGVLVNTRFAFFMTFFIAGSILLQAYLRDQGIILSDSEWHMNVFETTDALFLVAIFCIITIVSWLSNREIEKSLKRARRSEKALKKERDLLEIKVEQRTKALKESQLSRITQLERFAEFGRMASGIFHDLASPLTVVSLSLFQANKNKLDQKKITRVSGHMKRAMAAAKKLQDFITAVTKQIKKSSQVKIFSLNKEIEQVLQIAEYQVKKYKIKIIFKARQEYELEGDPIKFYQIVSNLVFNAIDACKEFTDQNKRRVVVTLYREKRFIVLTVDDFGFGISQPDLKKIFDPFFTTKKFDQGTGLGLATTKKIVGEDFKGEISAESILNKKTRFIVKFPEK